MSDWIKHKPQNKEEVEAFNNGMGTDHYIKWMCPECKYFNELFDYRCSSCGRDVVKQPLPEDGLERQRKLREEWEDK